MKQRNHFLISVLLISISIICNAQNVITAKYGPEYNATNIYISSNKIIFNDEKTKKQIADSKQSFKSVKFSNGLLITYSDFKVRSQTGYNYNSTVNLINGDFFTAEILHITPDRIIYMSPAGDDTLYISTEEVSEINYINGVREHFTSNDSTLIKAESEKPKTEQPHYKKSTAFYLGASVGYINSWTSSNQGFGYDYHLHGVTAGVSSYYDFTPKSSLNMNLAFAPKGVGFKSDTIDIQVKLTYLDLPVAYQLQGGNKNLKIMGEAGFYFSYLLSAKAIADYPTTNFENKITSELKHLDFGLLMGAGVKYYPKNGCAFAGIRYQFGLVSLGGYEYYNSANFVYFNTGELNNCYSIYAGYAIDINRLKNLSKKKAK